MAPQVTYQRMARYQDDAQSYEITRSVRMRVRGDDMIVAWLYRETRHFTLLRGACVEWGTHCAGAQCFDRGLMWRSHRRCLAPEST